MKKIKANIMEDYPLILQASHVSEILGISKKAAYEVMDNHDFPLLRIGRCKRVAKAAFFQWVEMRSNPCELNKKA